MSTHLNAKLVTPWEARSESRLSLMFGPGQRPSAADIVHLSRSGRKSARAAGAPGFAVSHRPEPADWLELLAGGMTFDLVGLAPAAAAPMPATAHFYGFPDATCALAAEAITLMPGDHLRGGQNLLPVIRTMAGLAARLAALVDVTAVVWHPARCAMAPVPFAAAIARWLTGGAFPALGLTALVREDDGAIRSEGLAFFTGQELYIEPLIGKNTAENAKIATRLINQLVGSDPIDQPFETTGPNGEYLSVVPSRNDGYLRVWRRT